jgi:small subunit ribosomal protein S16
MKSHLAVGVRKGALTQEQADAKFAAWVSEKENKVKTHVDRVKMTAAQVATARLAEEAKVNQARIEKIAAKAAAAELAANPPVEEEVVATEEEVVAAEEASSDEVATEEAPAAEEATETPAE